MFAGAGPRLRCGGLQLGAGGLQLRDEPLLHLRQPARLRGLHQRTPGRQARGGPQSTVTRAVYFPQGEGEK